MTIEEAREWLRLDNSDNDETIKALLVAIPNLLKSVPEYAKNSKIRSL